MTDKLLAPATHARPHLLVAAEPGPGLRSVDDVRRATEEGFGKRLWQSVLAEAEGNLRREPYLATSDCPGRAAHHRTSGNRDFIIVDAVAQRLKLDALVWLITGEDRFLSDALKQMETVLDEATWPQWPDQAHLNAGCVADLRTGMLLRGFGYAYDWLHAGLRDADRRWIVEHLDRRAIQPYLHEVERGAWFTGTRRMNNWNTVIVGGAGTAAMALGDAHPRSGEMLDHAVHVMDAYMKSLGPEGEFDESVGYAGAMHCPVEFFAAHRYHTRGTTNRLGAAPFTDFCRWYMHMTLPPGRSARFGDCGADTAPKAAIFPPIAAAANDGVLQWFYVNHAGPDLRSDPALELLFYDPDLQPISPEGKLPRGRAYHAHGATWSSRTDWAPRTTACVVYGKAGHGNECHGHHDAGQVCLDAWAKPLIVDLGHPAPSYPEDFFTPNRWRYYNAGVVGHNVLMFGGREMRSAKDERPEVVEAQFNAHLADHWRRAVVLDAAFDDDKGGYWRTDTTPLYDGARSVRRTVVHLHPATVVVLDEATLEETEPISLRWHTADRYAPDDEGRFTVANEGVHLAARVARLDGAMSYHRREHAYHPPFDKARLGPPLEQRHESYVQATCNAQACRILTLFSAFAPEVEPTAWEQAAGGFGIRTPEGEVMVSVSDAELTVRNVSRDVGWTVPLR